LKLTLTIILTLGAVLIVTIGWIVRLVVGAYKTIKPPPGSGGIGVDVVSLMTWHHAPFYWLTVLLIIVLAGLAYWRWA
jgi:hypothetical protein